MREGCSLLVRNLRHETSPQKIRRSFEKWGEVRDVYLPLDYHNKRPRGFGFVEFVEEEGARRAVKNMTNAEIDGNLISVIVAQDRRKSPESMRRQQSQPRRGRPFNAGGYSDRYRDDKRDSGRYRSRSRSRSKSRDRMDDSYSTSRDRQRSSRRSSYRRSETPPNKGRYSSPERERSRRVSSPHNSTRGDDASK
eukprot:Selendium_serpulae@DN4237_c0_g1_i1.p1